MVKLIAADMDGTLLDDRKNLPAGFSDLLACLAKRGVAFAVASGRSYPALRMLFGEKSEELLMICDNGAHVRIPGKAPVYQCMPFSIVHAVLDFCLTLSTVVPVLCGVDGIYYPKAAKSQFEQEITNFYVQFSAIPYAELYTVTDPIIKIALCAMDGSLEQVYTALQESFGAEYEVVISGDVWMDMMCKQVSKGNALSDIQSLFRRKQWRSAIIRMIFPCLQRQITAMPWDRQAMQSSSMHDLLHRPTRKMVSYGQSVKPYK